MNATEKACIAIQQNPTAELEMVSRSQKGAIRRIHGDSHFNEMARYIQFHSGSTMEDLKAQFKNTGPVIGAVRKVVQRLPEKFQIKQVEGIKSAPVKNKKAKIAKKLEAKTTRVMTKMTNYLSLGHIKCPIHHFNYAKDLIIDVLGLVKYDKIEVVQLANKQLEIRRAV